jgi:hypothetical protein
MVVHRDESCPANSHCRPQDFPRLEKDLAERTDCHQMESLYVEARVQDNGNNTFLVCAKPSGALYVGRPKEPGTSIKKGPLNRLTGKKWISA